MRTNADVKTRVRATISVFALAALAVPSLAAQGARDKKDKKGGTRPAAAASELIDVPAAPGGFDLPPYTRVAMPNGLVVLLMEQNEVPIVNMRLTMKSGAADDPKARAGLASLTADLLTAGTATRSAQQLAGEIDFVGGTLAASADYDATTVAAQFLSKDADKQLELLADVALHPAFAQSEVDRIKQQRLAEIASLPEDARGYASLQFESALYSGTSYGHPATGLRASVSSVTRDDVVNFYKSHFSPSNGVLAVVGAFKTDEMLAKLRTAFGGWERREVPHETFGTPAPFTGRHFVVVDSPDATQTQIRIGAVGIARNDPDFYAVQVANTAFGGTFNAKLMVEIRVKRSLSYGAYSRFRARLNPGPFMIETFTKNETTRQTIDVALQTLEHYRDEPLTEGELAKAKNFILGQFPLGIETVDGLAATITSIEVFKLPRDFVETYAQKVRALTAAEVAAVIRKRFSPDNLLIVLLTNSGVTRTQLEGLGPIDTKNFIE